MKIIQINASYKPAFIYGGPTMSVAKLCEVLVSETSKGKGANREVGKSGGLEDGRYLSSEDRESGTFGKALIGQGVRRDDRRFDLAQGDNIEVEVLTTSANGPAEVPVAIGRQVLVDGVPVTYFRRLTKDHTHFSPGLLAALRGKLKAESREAVGQAQGDVRQANGRAGEAQGDNRSGKVLRQAQGDIIVHIHAWWNLVSVLSCLVALLYKVPVVLTPRGTLSFYSFGNRNSFIKKIIHKFLGEPLLKRCHVHVTSEKEKRDFLNLVKPRSITVIANIVELPEAVKSEELRVKSGGGIESSEFKIKSAEYIIENESLRVTPSPVKEEIRPLKLLFFSRVEQKKGLELLFEALKDVDFEYTLTIAGTGEQGYISELKRLAFECGIAGKIEWIGQQPPERKFEIMSSYDLMVLPSHDENFANVVIESLSVGTAVLVTENVGLSDYVTAEGLGWVCGFDARDLREKLKEASSNIEKLKQIRSEGPMRIREDFSEEKLVGEYVKMYKEVLDFQKN